MLPVSELVPLLQIPGGPELIVLLLILVLLVGVPLALIAVVGGAIYVFVLSSDDESGEDGNGTSEAESERE